MCITKGIKYSTVAYTPQQNGVAYVSIKYSFIETSIATYYLQMN